MASKALPEPWNALLHVVLGALGLGVVALEVYTGVVPDGLVPLLSLVPGMTVWAATEYVWQWPISATSDHRSDTAQYAAGWAAALLGAGYVDALARLVA